MRFHERHKYFLSALAAAGLVVGFAGCEELEQAFIPGDLPVVVATRVFVATGSGTAPPDCNAVATDVSWKLTRIQGVAESGEKTVTPDKALGFAGGFDDTEPPQPLPGWCIFRKELDVPAGTYAVEAKLTFQGTAWSESCSLAVFSDVEPCEAPDWVGFSAQGFGPGGPGCTVVNSVVENPECEIDDGFSAFPTPGG